MTSHLRGALHPGQDATEGAGEARNLLEALVP